MLKEINIFGVYIAPFAAFLVAALLVFYPVQKIMDRYEVHRWVWHASLFNCAVFVIILSLIGLLF